MSNDTPIFSYIKKKEKEFERTKNATTQNSASIGTIEEMLLSKSQKQRKSNTLFLWENIKICTVIQQSIQ